MKMFTLVWLTLMVLFAGCGDGRTSGKLRTTEEVEAITRNFVPGTTMLHNAYEILGPWHKAYSSPDRVSYWTSGGGETTLTFSTVCVDNTADSGCYSGISHTD